MATDPISILMIDDDPEDAFLMKRALARLDAKAQFNHESDGAAFVRGLSDPNIKLRSIADVFVLDINMPRINGFDILQRMAERSDFADIKVIVFSTSETAEDRSRALHLGASQFFSKPTSSAALTEFARYITKAPF